MLGCQPPPKALERAAALRVSQFREVLRSPRPEVPELFARLCAGGIAIGMISDCSGETPLIWPELVWAKPITAPVFSFQERQRKPAAELYHLAASRLGVRVGECLYVGDGGSQELSGARAAGMEAWQLLLPRQDGEPHLQYDPDRNWDGPRIRDLRQLLGPAPG